MKYINLRPMTAEQMAEKAEKAWLYYDAYFSPIDATEVKKDHDTYVAEYIAIMVENEARFKRNVESITIFDEIIGNATHEELTYCLGSKVNARIRGVYQAAFIAARDAGDTELMDALSNAQSYALSVVRHLAMGNKIPDQADDTIPENAESAQSGATQTDATQADADAYPPEVIALAGQIAEDVLACDDDGITTVNHKAIAADIMRIGAAAAIAKYRLAHESKR